jgi:hypothetical protein
MFFRIMVAGLMVCSCVGMTLKQAKADSPPATCLMPLNSKVEGDPAPRDLSFLLPAGKSAVDVQFCIVSNLSHLNTLTTQFSVFDSSGRLRGSNTIGVGVPVPPHDPIPNQPNLVAVVPYSEIAIGPASVDAPLKTILIVVYSSPCTDPASVKCLNGSQTDAFIKAIPPNITPKSPAKRRHKQRKN